MEWILLNGMHFIESLSNKYINYYLNNDNNNNYNIT